MVTFLTSSPTGDLDGKFRVDGIDYRNGFCEVLRTYWKENSRCLIVSASPDEIERNEEFAHFWFHALDVSGLSCTGVDLLDARTMDISREEIQAYDVIVLGGGHVPTQNAFLHKMSLREKMEGFDGIVIGISAGSMNAADVVYAQPEEEGESLDPDYQRFLPGLGLTDINILPHYQMLKDSWLDGQRLFEDITFPDSLGKKFLAIPDGSYVVIRDGYVSIHGEAWKITPEKMERIHFS
ncbi:MAG: Type 1 glutamine amidotransferase-like domain-containing protein [Eubacteriales bacterium]|nr:Type 1 glutamine amidotransferase-like domain-containing protein [Eubacteriales bacterium]